MNIMTNCSGSCSSPMASDASDTGIRSPGSSSGFHAFEILGKVLCVLFGNKGEAFLKTPIC